MLSVCLPCLQAQREMRVDEVPGGLKPVKNRLLDQRVIYEPETGPPPASSSGERPIIRRNRVGKTSDMELVQLGRASNAFTIIRPTTNQVMVNDELQAVGWLHRQNVTQFPGTPQTTANGVLRLDLSLDGGESFDVNIGPFNPLPYGPPQFNTNISARARYPQGAFYFPSGDVSAENMRLVWMSAITDGGGWGNLSYGIASDIPNFGVNQTNDIEEDKINFNFVSRFQDRGVLIPGGLCKGKDGEFWTFDNSHTPGIGEGGRNEDSLLLWKGRYLIGEDGEERVDWQRYARFEEDWVRAQGNDASAEYFGVTMDFSPDGKWGWAVTSGSTWENYRSRGVFERVPHFWYSEDSGATWQGPIKVFLRDYQNIRDTLLTVFVDENEVPTDTSSGIPIQWSTFDLAVDANGNPHLMMMVANSSFEELDLDVPINRDSLGFGLPGARLSIFDITTPDNGRTWCPRWISDAQSYTGQPAGATDFNYGSYLQCSKNATGTHIFYSWVDDTTAEEPDRMNLPNLYRRALRIEDNAITEIESISQDGSIYDSQMFFPTVGKTILTRPDGTYVMPTVFVDLNNPVQGQLTPCDFYYIKNRTFTEADFIPPSTDLSVSVSQQEYVVCGEGSFTINYTIRNEEDAIDFPTEEDFITMSYTVIVDGSPVTFTDTLDVGERLDSGQTYEGSFTQDLDISESGTYVVTVQSNVAGDNNCKNNIQTFTVISYGGSDGELLPEAEIDGCGAVTLNTQLPSLADGTTWTIGGNPIPGTDGQAVVTLTRVELEGENEATVTVTVPGPPECPEPLTDEIRVVINDPPVTQVEDMPMACGNEGETLTLTATPEPADKSIEWSWDNGNRTSNDNELVVDETNDIDLTITDEITGCVLEKTVRARVWDINLDLPEGTQENPYQVCEATQIDAANASTPANSGLEWVWLRTGTVLTDGGELVWENDTAITSSGVVTTVDSLAHERAVKYEVVVKDPIGCYPDGVRATVWVSTFDTIQARLSEFSGVKMVLNETGDCEKPNGNDPTNVIEETKRDTFHCGFPVRLVASEENTFRTPETFRRWTLIPPSSPQLGLEYDVEGEVGNASGGGDQALTITFKGCQNEEQATRCEIERTTLSAVLETRSGACEKRDTFRINVINFIVSRDNDLEIGADLNVFPNPSEDAFNLQLELESPSPITIMVTDLNGRILRQRAVERTSSYTGKLDLSDEPAGVYVLKIQTDRGMTHRRLIKD